MLSFGLVVPFVPQLGATAIEQLRALAAPPKHVTFVAGGRRTDELTRAATVGDLLAEHGITKRPDDLLDADVAAPLAEGETIAYRAAVPVALSVDAQPVETVRTVEPTVGALLAARGVGYDAHDRVEPRPTTRLASDLTIRVLHVTSWIERARAPVAPPEKRVFDTALAPGKTRLVDPGVPGVRELVSRYDRSASGSPAHRTTLAARLLRAPRARVVAEGVATYASLADLAREGMEGTIRLATSALSMVATAYTASCTGCSGTTASGQHAGHGIVAVDPRVIPLGTKLFIPGYGRALAGDTGGAIRGNRIDLGMDRVADAFAFGRRSVRVYVLR